MDLSTALQKAVGACAQPYYKHKRRLERERRQGPDYGYLYRPRRQTLQERLFEIFPKALDILRDAKTKFEPMTRQLYYPVRRMLQESGCSDELTDAYHRTVLERYEVNVVGRRVCYRKAVGHMVEPHSTCPECGRSGGVDLGTEGVGHYVVPKNRFNKVLYVEKLGFMQQLLAADIHNRLDVAIAAGAGFAVHAARELFAKIEQTIPVTIYCLHDADLSGLDIARAMGNELLHEKYRVRIVDLGLGVAEALELKLPSESVEITAEPSRELRDRVTREELDWLLGVDVREQRRWRKGRRVLYVGKRIELNAFTPREFITWVEGKFKNLPGKIVPDAEVIASEFDAQRDAQVREAVVDFLLKRFDLAGFIDSLPKLTPPTAAAIRKEFAAVPSFGWCDVVEGAVAKKIDKLKIDERAAAWEGTRSPR